MAYTLQDWINEGKPLNRLVCCDCLELLKRLPNSSVDLVITDPPYNVLGTNLGYRQEWDTFNSSKEYFDFMKKCFDELNRVTKENSQMYVFWSQKYLKEGLEIFNPNRVLIWYHPNLAKCTNKMFLWTYDPIFYIKKGNPIFKPSFLKKENTDVFTYPKPQSNWKGDNKRFHPASKPVQLISNFIKISSKENDLVLDPFIGCGTTALACIQKNRNFIGCDINQEYVDIALERISKQTKPLNYFEGFR